MKTIIKKIFLCGILCLTALFLFYIYIAQPDYGGSEGCYRRTGINMNTYKGEFIPEFTMQYIFPPIERYKFHLKKSDFYVLKSHLEKRFGCIWERDTGSFFPGMEIQKDNDIFTYFVRKKYHQIIWLNYNTFDECLYIGSFCH